MRVPRDGPGLGKSEEEEMERIAQRPIDKFDTYFFGERHAKKLKESIEKDFIKKSEYKISHGVQFSDRLKRPISAYVCFEDAFVTLVSIDFLDDARARKNLLTAIIGLHNCEIDFRNYERALKYKQMGGILNLSECAHGIFGMPDKK